jgi:elongator complex protein 1
VDHSPSLFLTNGSEFLNQVGDNIEYLNLFLTQLNQEDVTMTLYSSFYKNKKQEMKEGDKIQRICSSLMNEMKKNEKKYITSILTTFKKMNQMEESLFYLKEMKDRELSEEIGLKYLIFLSNVDELYDIALGMYDVELVMLIAKKSQKDPKEYLRFFEEISKYKDVNYQHYKIDLHLKKYVKALHHLSKCQEVTGEEILTFIDKYSLYMDAIPLFPSLVERIFDKYGDYLVKLKKYKESAFIYLKGNQWEKAQVSFIQCGDLVHTYSLSKRLLQSKEKVIQISMDLISVLNQQLEFKKVSFILVEYLKNVEDSILLLCKHYYWNDAIQYALQYNRLDLMETNIKPSLLSSFKDSMDFIQLEFDKMKKHLDRLIQVRQELSLKSNVIYYIGGEFHEKEELNDAFSDTSSVASGYSGVSIMSTTSNSSGKQSIARSKSKRNKLKKGSPFEQDLLVKRLYSLIPSESKQCKLIHWIYLKSTIQRVD